MHKFRILGNDFEKCRDENDAGSTTSLFSTVSGTANERDALCLH